MVDVLEWINRLADVAYGFVVIGAALLLLERSRLAAGLGVGAGVVRLLSVVVYLVRDLAFKDVGRNVPVRVLFMIFSGFVNLAFYGCMLAAVLTLAKARAQLGRGANPLGGVAR